MFLYSKSRFIVRSYRSVRPKISVTDPDLKTIRGRVLFILFLAAATKSPLVLFPHYADDTFWYYRFMGPGDFLAASVLGGAYYLFGAYFCRLLYNDMNRYFMARAARRKREVTVSSMRFLSGGVALIMSSMFLPGLLCVIPIVVGLVGLVVFCLNGSLVAAVRTVKYLYCLLLKEIDIGDVEDQQPIVLLRSFSDDRLPLIRRRGLLGKVFLAGTYTLEEALASRLSKHGYPIVAVSPSDQKITPWGFPRVRLPDDSWQETVDSLIRSSSMVLAIVGDIERSSGLRWELKQALELRDISKVVLCLPPIEIGLLDDRWMRLCAEFPGLKPEDVGALFVRFTSDGKLDAIHGPDRTAEDYAKGLDEALLWRDLELARRQESLVPPAGPSPRSSAAQRPSSGAIDRLASLPPPDAGHGQMPGMSIS